jgi:hypothetical protein
MKRVRALLVAVTLAALIIARSTSDDLLRAVCAGLGPDNPLYDYLGCAELLRPSPEG